MNQNGMNQNKKSTLAFPALPPATSAVNTAVSDLGQRALQLWRRILRLSRRAPRRLRLCESLPLGERRFVAVVEFGQARFLLGGTSASLVLLARLEDLENAGSLAPEASANLSANDDSGTSATAVSEKEKL
jgi:flagellar biogenesis protein FliO